MINPKEIRLGNLLQLDGKGIICARGIDFDEYRSEPGEYYINNFPIEYLSPIQLTEEWMVKFHGEEYNKGYLLPNSNGYRMYVERASNGLSDNYFKYWTSMVNSVDIHYVHQLQNLYYAISGQDLQVKI